MEYTKESVRVGPSSHGLGVFSLRPFVADDLVGPIQGEIVENPQYGSDYCIDLGDQSLEPLPPFRYLNHSCQPNCALVVYDEDDEQGATRISSVWLEILCEIAPGEQMTIDYAWPAEAAIPCQCGTASCRGWIVSKEGLDEVVSARQDSLVAN
jgi:SET domain-containing protein